MHNYSPLCRGNIGLFVNLTMAQRYVLKYCLTSLSLVCLRDFAEDRVGGPVADLLAECCFCLTANCSVS